MKTLITLALLSGCMSTTYLTATQTKECVPAPIVGGDVILGGLLTFGGVASDNPTLAAGGGVYLALSTVLWFAQMASCEWVH